MIEINLLPQELRVEKKIKKPQEIVVYGLGPKHALLFIPVILLVFIIMHLYFGVISITKSAQLNNLNNKWAKLQNERTLVDNFKRENSLLSEDSVALQQMTGQRVLWAPKLNKLSLALPPGIWFDAVNITLKDFTLNCSAVSLQKEEIALINKFLDNLKNDPGFFNDFISLELGSVQKKTVGSYEVSDFSLNGNLKIK